MYSGACMICIKLSRVDDRRRVSNSVVFVNYNYNYIYFSFTKFFILVN